MPSLQVRDLPDDLYARLGYLARREHRSIAQETIVILREGISSKLSRGERRRKLLVLDHPLDIDGSRLPDPAVLLREDRER